MELSDLRDRTFEHSGEWGLRHVERLLKLIAIIGEDQEFDKSLIWIAAHLHDWGAYPPFVEEGKDHAVRSREVAVEVLKQLNLDVKQQTIVLDAIGEHNGTGPCSGMEATLLRDADNLDFLGIIGIARDFAKGPKDLKKCMAAIQKRMKVFDYLILPKSIAIGQERLEEMKYFIERMESDSFGLY